MVLRATSMALAAQEALQHQVVLKPTTETITLIDDIIPEDMVKQENVNSNDLKLIAFYRIRICLHKNERTR